VCATAAAAREAQIVHNRVSVCACPDKGCQGRYAATCVCFKCVSCVCVVTSCPGGVRPVCGGVCVCVVVLVGECTKRVTEGASTGRAMMEADPPNVCTTVACNQKMEMRQSEKSKLCAKSKCQCLSRQRLKR